MEKKSNKSFLIIIVVIVILALVGGGIYFFMNKTNFTKANVPRLMEGYTKLCTLKTDDETVYDVYYLDNVLVKDNQVIKSQSVLRYELKNKQQYEDIKKSENEKTVLIDDEKNLVLQYSLSGENDYTINDDGEEQTITYEDYKGTMESIGYTCD